MFIYSPNTSLLSPKELSRRENSFKMKVIYLFNTVLPCFGLCIVIANKWSTLASTSSVLDDHLCQVNSAITFVMPPKKTTVPGAVLAPLDTNQDGVLVREAQSQKRKAINPTPQDEELDQEISDLEAVHQ
jgi:hypothetical protein